MKVLIITYYWPPAGGSGVQRWLKFVKYLVKANIEVTVFTPQNAAYPIIDNSLCSDVPEEVKIIKAKIIEPNQYLRNSGKIESAGQLHAKPNVIQKCLQYIRANLFIPDARKFWVKPATRFLVNYLKNNSVDIVVTTGPPHSLHLIAYALKRKMDINWIADFRDPWTEIDYFHQLPLTKSSIKKHKRLESNIISSADHVLVVGNSMKNKFKLLNKNVSVITNGFDSIKAHDANKLDDKFTIVHIGLMNADRNPKILWEALLEISVENESFKNDFVVTLIGTISSEVKDSIKVFESKNIIHLNYMSHEEVRMYQLRSQVLLLCINDVPSAKGIITGKIFEYIQAKRPILAIGPEDGDAAEIIRNTNSGVCIDFNKKNEVKNYLLHLYKKYKAGSLTVESSNIDQYHRKNLTKKLISIMVKTASYK